MILALKTAGLASEWHLLTLDGVTAGSWQWDSGRQLADGLLTRLAASIGELGASPRVGATVQPGAPGQPFAALTAIIVFSGPGSFTSLRIGHAVANALADGYGVPVVGAAGDEWIARGLEAIATAQTGVPAMPEYGVAPNVKPPAGHQGSNA